MSVSATIQTCYPSGMFDSSPTNSHRVGALTAGERIEMHRRRRGLSRKVVAGLVGRSEEWLRLIESGRRKLDSIEVWASLCEVLHIDNPAEIIDWPVRNVPRPKPAYELRELRRLVIENPALRARETVGRNDDIDKSAMVANLLECQHIWSGSPRRYSTLARQLPAVLRACLEAEWYRPDSGFQELLVTTYHLAGQVFSGHGDHNSAALVTDRAMVGAAQTRRPELISASAWFVGNALLQSSDLRECHDYALGAAQRLFIRAPETAEDAAIWGALHLTAAIAAGLAQNWDESRRLFALSEKIADDLDKDIQVRGILFGPTEVAIAGMQIALAHHATGEVIRLAAETDITDGYPLQRHVQYHICQALAFVDQRDEVAATLALTRVAALCPEDIRHHPDVHRCLQFLIARNNYLVRSEVDYLTKLAEGTDDNVVIRPSVTA
ncbi:helix-turn-helix domain-containing protein [Mycobacterium sp. LTG2003]